MLNLYRNTCTSLVRASKPVASLVSTSQQAKLVPALCDQSMSWCLWATFIVWPDLILNWYFHYRSKAICRCRCNQNIGQEWSNCRRYWCRRWCSVRWRTSIDLECSWSCWPKTKTYSWSCTTSWRKCRTNNCYGWYWRFSQRSWSSWHWFTNQDPSRTWDFG